MSQQELPYCQTRCLWFPRTSGIHQPILAFPVIGFISLYQAAVIFGIGMPSLFITMTVTGQIYHGVIPLLAVSAFAMVRPPVLSYESRLLAIILFYVSGNKVATKKVKKKRRTSEMFSKPSPSFLKKAIKKHAMELLPVEKMTMHVMRGGLAELSIRLRNRDGEILRRRKVRISLDDTTIRTDRTSSSGEVSVTLPYEDCTGTRRITITDSEGTRVEKEVTFCQV